MEPSNLHGFAAFGEVESFMRNLGVQCIMLPCYCFRTFLSIYGWIRESATVRTVWNYNHRQQFVHAVNYSAYIVGACVNVISHRWRFSVWIIVIRNTNAHTHTGIM